MAGIGTIGGGLSPYGVQPPGPPVASNGRNPSGALGTRAGLGETNSDGPTAGLPIDANRGPGQSPAAQDLTDEEQQEVKDLKQRDAEVRRHEQAHVAAAGRYAKGGPQYEFTTGPDGRQYATGGHVNIDVSPARTPEATLQKAQVIRRAALAPAEPSSQDRAVANAASQLEAEARRDIQEARQAESSGGEDGDASSAAQGPSLQPPPPIPQRDFSEYVPNPGSGGGGDAGGISGIQRLDLLV